MFRKKPNRISNSRRLCFESLEDRRLLAGVSVNTISDTVDGTVINGLLGPTGLIANPGTDGKISLREAIEAANFEQGADEITFDPTVFNTPQTITLGRDANGNLINPNQQQSLSITESVTIDAEGKDITIDADSDSYSFDDRTRVFTIFLNGANESVTLEGLKITGEDNSENICSLCLAA